MRDAWGLGAVLPGSRTRAHKPKARSHPEHLGVGGAGLTTGPWRLEEITMESQSSERRLQSPTLTPLLSG